MNGLLTVILIFCEKADYGVFLGFAQYHIPMQSFSAFGVIPKKQTGFSHIIHFFLVTATIGYKKFGSRKQMHKIAVR